MNNQLNDHLVDLHHKVAALKVYDDEAGKKLNTYSHEFGKMINELLDVDTHTFNDIHLAYIESTVKNCSLAAKGQSEHDRSKGFYDGVGALNNNINDSLEYFSVHK
ncbi:hypothetical protein KXQ82_05250 [Mucilaginibacter sp. HMF5004]|uniref:hypothetical protein n=1 Tax=Mucilaginibacter rivuli TaxID=2857527 RepID=UPI001C5FDB04|nr:hypothetical protein [Mucilaginibacter rivuli]MBW4889108.1 hypothetical protein [Mucilaginibacter rivuli]